MIDNQKTRRDKEGELLTLILSLSRKEHKYLEKTIAKGKETKYIKLFQWILKTGNYKRSEYLKYQGIITPEQQDKALNNLRNVETNLFEQIYKTIRVAADKSILTKLSNLIAEADTLKRRGHYLLALDRLQLAEKEAKQYQKFFVLVEIIPLKAEVILYLKKEDRQAAIEEQYLHLHHIIHILQEEANFKHQNVRWVLLSQTIKNRDEIEEAYTQAFNTLVTQGFPEDGTFYAQYYFYSVQAIYNKVHHQPADACRFQQKVLELWEQPAYKHIRERNLQRYITQLNNLATFAIGNKEYSLAQANIDKIKALTIEDTDGQAEKEQATLYIQQTLYMNTENFEQAYQLIPTIKQALIEHNHQINPSRQYTFSFHNLIVCFLLKKYDEAHFWLSKTQYVIDLKKYEARKDVQQFLHILQLAIFYHNNSVEFANSVIRRIERKDVTDPIIKRFSAFECLFFDFTKQLHKDLLLPKQEQQPIALFKAFEQTLKAFPNKNAFGYELVEAWIQQVLDTK